MSNTTDTPAAGSAGDSDGGKLASVRQSAADAYQAARDRTASAYSSARQGAASAGRRTADGIDGNPMAALVGGLALGAIIGALVPVSRREKNLLGDVGRRINDTARDAVTAARDAGKERLDGFTDQALGAVRASAKAAAGSVSGGDRQA